MTANGKQRSRGKPRAFDEDELVARIRSFDEVRQVQAAVEAIGASAGESRGLGSMLMAKKAGDPTGGVSRRTMTRYRQLLAELPFDPLAPTPGRNKTGKAAARARRRSQSGLADRRAVLGVASVATAGFAVQANSAPVAGLAAALLAADNTGDAGVGGQAEQLVLPLWLAVVERVSVAAESLPDAPELLAA